MPAIPNQLIHESSPYLLQHAYNPVKWHAWDADTLTKAIAENKLMIISVGYSACHWCHVMEHESFEDDNVAGLMNKYFISVKVDREERPDVDQVYMHAAYLSSGRGGWPLNVITLPDGKPVYGGTYFPKHNWIRILEYFSNLYLQDPEKLSNQAAEMMQGIKSMDTPPLSDHTTDTDWLQILNEGTALLFNNIDWQNGGKSSAPKFMMPDIWEYLLAFYSLKSNVKALDAVKITLEKMALGGLYDHLAGGFARYSTDDLWKIPHFEKMLYDNAQLINLYTMAFSITGDNFFKRTATNTIAYCNKEWQSPEGGYYSALDADSDGEEGKYYTWTKEEIESCLGKEAERFIEIYTITGPGNWEKGWNVLHRIWDDKILAQKLAISEEELVIWFDSCHNKLLEKRQHRTLPQLDNKQLCSWNAMMITALCNAYNIIGNKTYLDRATEVAGFIQNKLNIEGKLHRNYCGGNYHIPAFLDDYALLIEAYLQLYQSTFNIAWLQEAVLLTEQVLLDFSDQSGPFFYYNSDKDSNLISRPIELSDNVISSSNSIMAHNLWQLGWILDSTLWRERAVLMCSSMEKEISNNLAFYSNWAKLALYISKETVQVVIIGLEAADWKNKLGKSFFPGMIILGAWQQEDRIPLLLGKKPVVGKTLAYICRNKTCGLAILSIEDVLMELNTHFHQSSSV